MAAYGAVISLTNTINHLLQSSHISLVPPSPQILHRTKLELESFQEILEQLDRVEPSKSRKKVNALDGRIKEAVWEFEDLLESHLYNNILASQFSVDLQSVLKPDADSFFQKLKDLQEEYIHELHNMPLVEEDELVSSEFGSSGTMVGLSDDYERVIRNLTQRDATSIVLAGMPGIGKTVFAKKIFEDRKISKYFKHRVWIPVGRNYESNKIAGAILAQLDRKGNQELKERLKGKSCLIVLDDVWDKHILEFLEDHLPVKRKFAILITSRLLGQIKYKKRESEYYCSVLQMRLLNVDESKELLLQRVFGEAGLPYNLKEALEKIAKNCEGLPLMILRVAHRLSEAKNLDPEYWNEVAKRRSSVFMEAYDEISKVLFPTYDCLLPQNEKTLCIYFGAFPRDYEITKSRLGEHLFAERHLFVERSIVENLISENGDYSKYFNQILFKIKENRKSGVKSFGVRSWWLHLFEREAYNDTINRVFYNDEAEEGIKGHRRLCLHTNFLFNFENIYDIVKCDCASTARPLLCFGPYHQYSMPLDVGFKLLRVLDALKVRFYSFPIEILQLPLLQYLALTCNGKLPSSISKLFNLQFLIVHRHMSIKSCGHTSYLPVQIWDMQELRHIEISGGNLPKPNSHASLKNLSKLLGVSPESCTREVFEKIPNIRKLGIEIELSPPHNDETNPFSCFDHISELAYLESLKCSIVNPEMTLTPPPILKFPSKLQKLNLSGLGFPWECMKVIGLLPDLKVLKLRCYAFRGPKWEPESESFMHVEYLLIEDTDLVQWKPADESFLGLRTLCMKHCYRLQEFDWPSRYDGKLELVDCNPLAVACAKKLKEIGKTPQVVASFDNKKLITHDSEWDQLDSEFRFNSFMNAMAFIAYAMFFIFIFLAVCVILIIFFIFYYFIF